MVDDICSKCKNIVTPGVLPYGVGYCSCHEKLCNNCCAKQISLELQRKLRKMGLPESRSTKLRKNKLQTKKDQLTEI